MNTWFCRKDVVRALKGEFAGAEGEIVSEDAEAPTVRVSYSPDSRLAAANGDHLVDVRILRLSRRAGTMHPAEMAAARWAGVGADGTGKIPDWVPLSRYDHDADTGRFTLLWREDECAPDAEKIDAAWSRIFASGAEKAHASVVDAWERDDCSATLHGGNRVVETDADGSAIWQWMPEKA